MIDDQVLAGTLECVRRHGGERVGLCWAMPPDDEAALAVILSGHPNLVAIVDTSDSTPPTFAGLPRMSVSDAATLGIIDSLLVVDRANLHIIMRRLEPLARSNVLILPYDPEWCCPSNLKSMTAAEAAWNPGWASINYVARSELKGHYAEFGTFWGANFFYDFPCYQHFLDRFYAFDSFAGLSPPKLDETRFQPDFVEGHYCSNERSFRAVADLVGFPEDRLRIVPGFYSESLAGKDPSIYDLAPESLSVCKIDCDLFEPTQQILDFVLPLLHPGSLIYFDDWRLTRASPHVGERGAALAWLRRNPYIELVEFHRHDWQHQWFIFHRL